MSSAETDPIALWSRLSQARTGLRALPIEARAGAIARVAAKLARADEALIAELSASCGLSPENVRFGLTTTFGAFDEGSLRALARSASSAPCDAVALVLAGNVFSACARPMLLALLAGAPLLAKASSRDAALPLALARALSDEAPALSAACAVLAFPRDDARRLRAVLESADSVHVLGSDEAIEALRAELQPSQRFVGRGHGLGFGYAPREAIASEAQMQRAADAFALDVAAYDQRGCLSPHAIFVEGATEQARAFALRLHAALAALERAQPRGAIPAHAAAEQVQWRGLAAARGELFDGGRFAVSCEDDLAPRPSPGYRNIGVYALRDESALSTRFGALAAFVKALGVAGEGRRPALAPYVCAAGAMQTPPLDAPLDGLHPLAGFTR